ECLKRTRRVFLLPAIMVLWAICMAAFCLVFLLLAFFGGMALLKRDWVNFRIFGFVGIGCFIATLINPLGWHIYRGLETVLGHFSQAYITEWWPYYRNVAIPGSIPGIIYILVFVAFELRFGRSGPIEARLISWLFLFLGLYQFRYMSFFFMFSTIPL